MQKQESLKKEIEVEIVTKEELLQRSQQKLEEAKKNKKPEDSQAEAKIENLQIGVNSNQK